MQSVERSKNFFAGFFYFMKSHTPQIPFTVTTDLTWKCCSFFKKTGFLKICLALSGSLYFICFRPFSSAIRQYEERGVIKQITPLFVRLQPICQSSVKGWFKALMLSPPAAAPFLFGYQENFRQAQASVYNAARGGAQGWKQILKPRGVTGNRVIGH